MKTIETKTNIDSGVEIVSGNNNVNSSVGLVQDGYKNMISSLITREAVNDDNFGTKNSHRLIEKELAKIFGLPVSNALKLEKEHDLNQPVTLAGVMAGADDFWEQEYLLAA